MDFTQQVKETVCSVLDWLWRPIFVLWFLPSIFLCSFFSSPNLSGRKLDVYHTSTHGVALVQINAGLKCAACSSLEVQDPKNSHLRTIAQLFGLYLHN